MGDLAAVAVGVAEALGRRPGRSQLVVVCGRNEAVQADLDARAWPDNVRVAVLGFVSDMERYMGAADVLVSKAGPGTIAEAAAMGLPCVLSSFLPGQEAGNVDFVADAGFGALHEHPASIGRTVREWLDKPAQLEGMAEAALAAARPDATADIARDLAKLVLGTRTASHV